MGILRLENILLRLATIIARQRIVHLVFGNQPEILTVLVEQPVHAGVLYTETAETAATRRLQFILDHQQVHITLDRLDIILRGLNALESHLLDAVTAHILESKYTFGL